VREVEAEPDEVPLPAPVVAPLAVEA